MTALSKFRERNRGSLSLPAVLSLLVVGGVAGYLVSSRLDHGGGISSRNINEFSSVELEAMEASASMRKEAALDAATALAKMKRALDPKSDGYQNGEDGIMEREADFVAASDDYQRAAQKLDRHTEAEIIADKNVGPNTSFKADDFAFSLDVLQALGAGDGKRERVGSFRP